MLRCYDNLTIECEKTFGQNQCIDKTFYFMKKKSIAGICRYVSLVWWLILTDLYTFLWLRQKLLSGQ